MRTITREKIMKLMYSLDVHRLADKENNLSIYLETPQGMDVQAAQTDFLINDKDEIVYFNETIKGIIEHLDAIDERIQAFTKQGWIISQFGMVERAILRLAVYELYWSEQEGMNTKIIVSEAIHLAERFSDEKHVKFIHGMLGAMTNNKKVEKEKAATKKGGYQKIDVETKKANLAALKQFNKKKRIEKQKQRELEEVETLTADSAD